MDAVGRLAGGIAHDFNNILTAILGYSDLLIGQIDERQWMYKHLAEIRKAADFAASLTHQLLAFSRRQPLFLRVFNMNDAVRNMQKMLERVIGEDIKIKTKLSAEIGRMKADPSQIEQVLLEPVRERARRHAQGRHDHHRDRGHHLLPGRFLFRQ